MLCAAHCEVIVCLPTPPRKKDPIGKYPVALSLHIVVFVVPRYTAKIAFDKTSNPIVETYAHIRSDQGLAVPVLGKKMVMEL
ncbi:MAG: hypothetical protein QW794_04910 [Thermosphaera sp.]